MAQIDPQSLLAKVQMLCQREKLKEKTRWSSNFGAGVVPISNRRPDDFDANSNRRSRSFTFIAWTMTHFVWIAHAEQVLLFATCLLVQDRAATRWATWDIFRSGFAV